MNHLLCVRKRGSDITSLYAPRRGEVGQPIYKFRERICCKAASRKKTESHPGVMPEVYPLHQYLSILVRAALSQQRETAVPEAHDQRPVELSLRVPDRFRP